MPNVTQPTPIPLRDLQRVLFDECENSGWDPEKKITFGEEIAHFHEEVSEAFREWRLFKNFETRYEPSGKPTGVGIEFADVIIGMFYNAELHGFNLLEVLGVEPDSEVTEDTFQRWVFDTCTASGWTPKGSFSEEMTSLHERVSKAFREWRLHKDCAIRYTDDGEAQGVPVEFGAALFTMFYNAEVYGFDLMEAIGRKHEYNVRRSYLAEGRQLHTYESTDSAAVAG